MAISTQFPAIPKTVWHPADPNVIRLVGELREGRLFVEGENGLAMRGPRIALDAGLYGVEFRVGGIAPGVSADARIAEVLVTGGDGSVAFARADVTGGDLSAAFGGMYQGVRVDVVLDQRVADIEFRVVSAGEAPFVIQGIKLVPRPGRSWFPGEMDRVEDAWKIAPDRSAVNAKSGVIAVRGITLNAGDHRLGVKLKPPVEMLEGDIAEIRVTGGRIEGGEIEVIAEDRHVTAEAMRANFGIPDARLRWRLDGAYREVAVEVKALVPGVTLQWVRLATADEAVWHHYWNLGGMDSVVGLPVSAFEVVETEAGRLRGASRRFERGVIYWTIEHGPCEISGGILAAYEAAGAHRGEMGLPVGRPKRVGDQTKQTFEGGELSAGK